MAHPLGAYSALAVYNLDKLDNHAIPGYLARAWPGVWICPYDMEDAILLELAPLLLATPYMTTRRTGEFSKRAWAVTCVACGHLCRADRNAGANIQAAGMRKIGPNARRG